MTARRERRLVAKHLARVLLAAPSACEVELEDALAAIVRGEDRSDQVELLAGRLMRDDAIDWEALEREFYTP